MLENLSIVRARSSLIGPMILGITLLMVTVEARAMVTWDFDGTTLFGAGNVNVNGTLYDVQFMDGSCVELFNGCDNAIDDFTFTTQEDADDAVQALLDQVLLNPPFSPHGAFDALPGITEGCSEFLPLTTLICTIFVPHTIPIGVNGLVALAGAQNTVSDNDVTVDATRPIAFNLSYGGSTDEAYAIFTETAVVPIPAAIWLFGTALIGLVGFGKRRKAT